MRNYLRDDFCTYRWDDEWSQKAKPIFVEQGKELLKQM